MAGVCSQATVSLSTSSKPVGMSRISLHPMATPSSIILHGGGEGQLRLRGKFCQGHRTDQCGSHQGSLLPAQGPPNKAQTPAKAKGTSPWDHRHSTVLVEAGEQGTGALAPGSAGGPGGLGPGQAAAGCAPQHPPQGPGERAAPRPASQRAGLITAGVGGKAAPGNSQRMRRFVR